MRHRGRASCATAAPGVPQTGVPLKTSCTAASTRGRRTRTRVEVGSMVPATSVTYSFTTHRPAPRGSVCRPGSDLGRTGRGFGDRNWD